MFVLDFERLSLHRSFVSSNKKNFPYSSSFSFILLNFSMCRSSTFRYSSHAGIVVAILLAVITFPTVNSIKVIDRKYFVYLTCMKMSIYVSLSLCVCAFAFKSVAIEYWLLKVLNVC